MLRQFCLAVVTCVKIAINGFVTWILDWNEGYRQPYTGCPPSQVRPLQLLLTTVSGDFGNVIIQNYCNLRKFPNDTEHRAVSLRQLRFLSCILCLRSLYAATEALFLPCSSRLLSRAIRISFVSQEY